MAGERAEAEKAIRHAEFRSLRDLNRDWNVGSVSQYLKWNGELSAEANSRLTAFSAEFVTAKGRDRNWTEKSLRQRLEAASLRFESNSLMLLNASAFNIYSTASEVVHASYFSALYFFGLTTPGGKPPQSQEELKMMLAEHQFSVLLSAVLAFTSFVECFASYSEQPHLLDDASASLRKMRELPTIAEAMD